MTTKYEYRIPTTEELYALEAQARRLRAQVVGELLRDRAKAVRAFFARPAVAPQGGRTVRHA